MTLPNVAYFSMEIAMDQSLSTYSGGLGFLAGSHMLSAGYLQMPMVGVTMLWSYGYYDQRIDHSILSFHWPSYSSPFPHL